MEKDFARLRDEADLGSRRQSAPINGSGKAAPKSGAYRRVAAETAEIPTRTMGRPPPDKAQKELGRDDGGRHLRRWEDLMYFGWLKGLGRAVQRSMVHGDGFQISLAFPKGRGSYKGMTDLQGALTEAVGNGAALKSTE